MKSEFVVRVTGKFIDNRKRVYFTYYIIPEKSESMFRRTPRLFIGNFVSRDTGNRYAVYVTAHYSSERPTTAQVKETLDHLESVHFYVPKRRKK